MVPQGSRAAGRWGGATPAGVPLSAEVGRRRRQHPGGLVKWIRDAFSQPVPDIALLYTQ